MAGITEIIEVWRKGRESNQGPIAGCLSSVNVAHVRDISQGRELTWGCCYFKMAVKQRIPQVLKEKCFDLFESRWPDEHPIEINAYKLMKLTGLASGTCLKIFNNPYYVPDFKVMNALCAFFDIQPGDFLYYERDIAPLSSDRTDKIKQIA